jgi:hypothetical protein
VVLGGLMVPLSVFWDVSIPLIFLGLWLIGVGFYARRSAR